MSNIEDRRSAALTARQARVKREARIAGGVLAFIVLIALAIIGLFGWGFIELIGWVTSK